MKFEGLIFSDEFAEFTDEDWAELAMVAIDQAGLQIPLQRKVAAVLFGAGLLAEPLDMHQCDKQGCLGFSAALARRKGTLINPDPVL